MVCIALSSCALFLCRQIVHHMREAADKLGVPDQQEAALAARTVARCLGLATAAVTYAEVRAARAAGLCSAFAADRSGSSLVKCEGRVTQAVVG